MSWNVKDVVAGVVALVQMLTGAVWLAKVVGTHGANTTFVVSRAAVGINLDHALVLAVTLFMLNLILTSTWQPAMLSAFTAVPFPVAVVDVMIGIMDPAVNVRYVMLYTHK